MYAPWTVATLIAMSPPVQRVGPMAVSSASTGGGQAEDAGLIRLDSLGPGGDLAMRVETVQGAYMLGEETVLLKALEGKRGQPEQRPPHPAERGLFGAPTVVQNVQTLAAVPWILANGAAGLRGDRLDGEPRHDPRPRPRRRAAPASPRSRSGTPLRAIVALAGELAGGRSSRRCSSAGRRAASCRRSSLDTPYEFDALREAGAHVGSGSRRRRRRARLRRRPGPPADPLLRRRGVRQDDPLPHRPAPAHRDRRPDRDRPPAPDRRPAPGRPVATTSSSRALCDHERLATLPYASGMRYFRSELDDHILRSSCPAGVCHPIAVAAGAGPTEAPDQMTDLIIRPGRRRRSSIASRRRHARRAADHDPVAAAAACRRRAIRIEVDGRVVEGLEGQTILEVCRDNGIEIPTLCYEPKLPGFGACRMCVVEVEGEEHPPISCSRACRAGMVVQTQTDEVRRLRATNLELIFCDHNAYCLPPCQNKCPSHIDIPGFLKANAEANWSESTRIFKRTIPFPSRPRPGLPGAVRGALPARRGRRGDRHPRLAIATPATRSSRRCSTTAIDPPLPFEQPAEDRAAGPRSSARGRPGMAAAYYLLIAGHDVTVFERDPAPGGMLRYGIPQYRLPKVEVLEAEYESVTRLGGKIVCDAGLGRDFRLDDLQNQGFDAVLVAIGCYETNKLGIPGEDADEVLDGLEYLRTATLGLRTPATPASGSSSSAAGSPRWTAPGPRSARARPRSRSSTAAT